MVYTGSVPHGTSSRYSNYGCRCEPCREAGSRRSREYYKKNRASRIKYSVEYQRRPDRVKARLGRYRDNRERVLALRKEKQDYIALRKSELGPCNICGSDVALEFDHIDRTTKRQNVTSMTSYSIASIEAEIEKCWVLCRVCHIGKSRVVGDFRKGKKTNE